MISSRLSRLGAAALLLGGAAATPWLALAPAAALASAYGALLLRGPFDRLQRPAS